MGDNGETKNEVTEVRPKTAYDMMPPRFQAMMTQLDPALIELDEKNFRARYKPSPTLNQLRIAFWAEYNRAMQQFEDRMVETKIYGGICQYDTYCKLTSLPRNVTFILKPPRHYTSTLEHILNLGLEKIEEIFMLPIKSKNGVPYDKHISNVLKAYHLIDQRVRGAVAIKHEVLQKNLNLNVNAPTQAEAEKLMEVPDKERLEYLDRQIAFLERKIARQIAAKKEQVQIGESKADTYQSTTDVIVVQNGSGNE